MIAVMTPQIELHRHPELAERVVAHHPHGRRRCLIEPPPLPKLGTRPLALLGDRCRIEPLPKLGSMATFP